MIKQFIEQNKNNLTSEEISALNSLINKVEISFNELENAKDDLINIIKTLI